MMIALAVSPSDTEAIAASKRMLTSRLCRRPRIASRPDARGAGARSLAPCYSKRCCASAELSRRARRLAERRMLRAIAGSQSRRLQANDSRLSLTPASSDLFLSPMLRDRDGGDMCRDIDQPQMKLVG